MFNEGNQIHNFMSSSGSRTVINYGSGTDFLTSYGSTSCSTSQKVTVPTVPVPQHWFEHFKSWIWIRIRVKSRIRIRIDFGRLDPDQEDKNDHQIEKCTEKISCF